jgi:ribosomal protein S18 acetylase RimI-like enzyme
MITSPETLKRVDAFWASYFGCTPEDVNGRKTLVVSHNVLQGYDGALVFRHADACIVSVPDTTPEIERSKLRAAEPAQAFDPKFLARVFVVSTDKVAGPAWLGVADRGDFKAVPTSARVLGDEDEPALERLAEGCGEMAWKQSKLLQVRKPLYGLFQGKDLVAVSGYVVMGNALAYIGVIAHPQHRGKGHAKAVVSAAVNDALAKGFVAQWRTPESNEGAVALAKSLGFQHYASTYDVQLVEDEF